MKHIQLVGMVALFAACSGTDETAVESDASETVKGAVESDARLVDRVEWNGEQLEFYDASSGAEGEEPEVLVTQLGLNSAPELWTVLEGRAHYPLTAAEIWLAATGRSEGELPDELARQHAASVAREERPEGYQRFDSSTMEKSFDPDFSTMFPLTQAATGATVSLPSACWDFGGIIASAVGARSSSEDISMCTGGSHFVRRFPVSDACDRVLNQNKTERAGSYQNTTRDAIGQHCFATGTGPWQCLTAVTVPSNHYFVTSFLASGTAHRLATGLHVPFSTPATSQAYLATAELAFTVHRFQDTACLGGFIKNF